MPWFRRRTRKEEETSTEASAEKAAEADAKTKVEGSAPAEPTRPRAAARRPARGSRGRQKAPGTGTAAKAKPKAQRETADRPKARRERRARQAPKSPPAPPVKKEILVSVDVGEQRVAVLEDGKPAEVYLERRGQRSLAGNVYKGVVDNVLPGMEASFVDVGLDRNGFLYVDEVVVPELEGKPGSRRIQELLERGQELLVQAVKDPIGTKGARLTTEISLPGRFLVYVPSGEGIGVSRRLDDAERERLRGLCKGLDVPKGGIIVRTAAEGASRDELEGDLAFLRKLWATIQGRANRAQPPTLIYQESELPLRIVRDLFIRDFKRVLVDHERTHRRIVAYLKRTSPELAAHVEWYRGREPLMERFGVDAAIQSTLNRRVDLPSGGYLVFDYAEAFTVIDVNTGRFVGGRGKGGGARLEETITKNNLEAVEEVVRQLRLRDIGGIIVIDFIDMANPKNRELVEEALQRELARDRTKTYVVEISPLGLVEMTRQRTTEGPREILTDPCPTCAGDGVIVSDETRAVEIERRLRQLAVSSRSEAFLVELNREVADILIGPGGSRLAELETETGRRFHVEAADEKPEDHFNVLAKGPAAKVGIAGLPVRPGQELMAKLEAQHPENEADAIARLDGYDIAVAGAAEKVGKRMKIRIERATRQSAYAVLSRARTEKAPIEAADVVEAEPEERAAAKKTAKAPQKGKRRPQKRKKAAARETTEAVAAPERDGKAGSEAEPPEQKPKKKTRRGSRGGRGRRKKPTEAGGAGSTSSAAMKPESAKPKEAPASVPAAGPTAGSATGEPSSDGAKPRRKTRRGSRGGRGRRRKAGAAAGSTQASETTAK